MAAFARSQRRLLRAGGGPSLHLASLIALTYAGNAIAMVPTVAVLVALRDARIRRALDRLVLATWRVTRRAVHRGSSGAEGTFEELLDRVAALRLPRLQYLEVFALALWNWVADCLCLGIAVLATGADLPWHVIFLAYGAGVAAGSLGLTPGGLGIVEAALTAALVGAGIKADHALAAVLIYRLISFWLVMACGWAVMGVLLRKEYRDGATQPSNAVSNDQVP